MIQYIADESHYKEVLSRVSKVRRSLWIGTADIKDLYVEDRPFLGICLGMQFLFEKSEECPGEPGLGFLKGEIRRFKDPSLRVPQIGWNAVHPKEKDNPLFKGISDGSHFYFVHSYYCVPLDASVTGSSTSYGLEYCSSLWAGNAFAVQFHPEKSQELGLIMLRNFINI